jgi:hypothetical protein
MQMLLQRCESERDELAEWFGFRLRRRLAVFLLDDKNVMSEVFERRASGFAMVPGNAIVLAADTGLEEVMRHELVHLFAARWSVLARPLFSEGIAVWLQRTWGGVPIDAKALRLIQNGRPSLSVLLSRKYFFADTNRNACYALAGSFTGFLIRRYGVEAYRKFFRKTDALNFQSTFRKVFGVTFAKAEWQWRTQLLTTAVLKRRLQIQC